MKGLPQDGSDLMAEIVACERRVWEALVTGNAAADRAALSPDFLGVYTDGPADRDAHADQLADGPTVGTYRMSEPRLMHLGPEHVLLAYRADFTRPGVEMPQAMYVSSIWRRLDHDWTNVFSQDTPVP